MKFTFDCKPLIWFYLYFFGLVVFFSLLLAPFVSKCYIFDMVLIMLTLFLSFVWWLLFLFGRFLILKIVSVAQCFFFSFHPLRSTHRALIINSNEGRPFLRTTQSPSSITFISLLFNRINTFKHSLYRFSR